MEDDQSIIGQEIMGENKRNAVSLIRIGVIKVRVWDGEAATGRDN